MFGTVLPKTSQCTNEQRRDYKKYYCGLCFALGEEFGDFSRLLLNYDLTNEFLLACLAFQDTCTVNEAVCPWSVRRKKVKYVQSDAVSQYLANLTYIFAYYKVLDDIADGGGFASRLLAKQMEKHISKPENMLCREKLVLETYLNQLHEVEKKAEYVSVFSVAEMFGNTLKNMVVVSGMESTQAEIFAQINYWTGIWIYTVDAVADCYMDAFKKRYNPILAGTSKPVAMVLESRKDELLGILKLCRKNLLDLSDLYINGENRLLLRNLFSQKLSGIVCMNLGVEKDVLES